MQNETPPDRPSDQPGADPPQGPQSPAPGSPQSPAGPAPEAPPSYPGQQPPGGWQTPAAPPQAQPWAGVPLAGWWARVGATLLDGLILTVPVFLLVFIVVVVAAGSDVGAVVTAIIGFLAYLVLALFYAPLLMARDGEHNGKTLGKQIVGIRVTRDSGQPFDLGAGFIREIAVKALLFGFVGGFFLSIPTLLDWLWPLWDDQNRTLHDMVVSSHVVRA